MTKLYIVGIGPGSYENMTIRAINAIRSSDVIVSYKKYIEYIKDIIDGKILYTGFMTQEVERCKKAIEYVKEGKVVSLISSGDAGLYGMAGLAMELNGSIEIEVIPGISAAFSASSILGAPLMHDSAFISLSDLMTEYETILKRIDAAASSDMVIALYNPKSKNRVKHINDAIDIISKYRDKKTPVGLVKNALREGQEYKIVNLGNIDYEFIDMNTIVIIGNSTSYVENNRILTPRGYKI